MRIGMPLSYRGGFALASAAIAEYEDAGLDVIFVPEAYSFDSVSQLGFLAAMTTRLQLASGIVNVYSRAPELLAVTAASLDYMSGGRFILGLGPAGPQSSEGFHDLEYTSLVTRAREVAEVCRNVWRDRSLNGPARERVPMLLAALRPKNVALAAELFEGWEPTFFYPDAAKEVFGAVLAEGAAKRDQALGPLQIYADAAVLITENPDEEARGLNRVREQLALHIGGMGAGERNFYTGLIGRYGFEAEGRHLQDLYLAGQKAEAAAALPDQLVRGVSLVGPRSRVAERVAAFAEAGVTTINASPVGIDHATRLASIAALAELVSDSGKRAANP
ncbi:MAG TPA: LLM class flavin-dependent oxidoreductase [Streptosporangiaceae bacterium]|nr:LLM class flavin-dependent oxidoreductase [Streptosporangiaceae bacterium]